MNRLVFGLISLSTAALSIAACSSSTKNAASADGGPSTSSDPCAVYASAETAFEEKCVDDIDPAHADAHTARYTTLCDGIIGLSGISPTFATALTTCAAALQAADCNTTADQITACTTGIPNGTLAVGQTCATDLQCASGGCSTDAATADGGTANCGTCLAPIPDGQSCLAGGACVAGDSCSVAADSSGDLTATCTKVTTPGALGATCASTDDCVGPNHCQVPDAGGNGTCTAPSAAGTECTSTSDCVAGLVCTGSDTTVCTTAVPAGGACTSSDDCVLGLGCDATSSKCATFTYGAPGAACDGATAFCSQGQCNLPQAGTTADGGTTQAPGTCPTVIADGQACDPNDQSATCDDYANCTNNICVLLPSTCN